MKVNLLNILTAVIIIIGLAASLYFFVLREEPENAAELVDVEYSVEFKEVRDELAYNIKDGDNVVDTVGQISIGTVEEVETVPNYSFQLDNETKELVKSEHPDYKDIIVTIRAKATVTETGYNINGCLVNVGRTVYARFPDFMNTGHCISIKVVND